MKAKIIDLTHTDGIADKEFELRLNSIRSKIENCSIRDRAIFEMSLITPAIEPLETITINVLDIDVKHKLVRIKVNWATLFYSISEKCSLLLEQMIDSISDGDTPLFTNEFGERLSLYQFWLIKRQILIDITLLVYEI